MTSLFSQSCHPQNLYPLNHPTRDFSSVCEFGEPQAFSLKFPLRVLNEVDDSKVGQIIIIVIIINFIEHFLNFSGGFNILCMLTPLMLTSPSMLYCCELVNSWYNSAILINFLSLLKGYKQEDAPELEVTANIFSYVINHVAFFFYWNVFYCNSHAIFVVHLFNKEAAHISTFLTHCFMLLLKFWETQKQ